jgi:hypothetical protein
MNYRRICRNILLNEHSQKIFFKALKDKGVMTDAETIFQILEQTCAIMLEERAILAKVIDALLLEKEEMKHDELQRLLTLLEDQRTEYIRDLKTLPEIQNRVNNLVEDLKKS